MSVLESLHKIVNRENLTVAEAEGVMERILDGEVSSTLVAGLLVALRMKGETPEELLGFARAMRSRAVRVDARIHGEPLVDTCGTGGDGSYTFNISTVAAFVIAGAGVRVAKHGNRSISSQCGSADILEALGVAIVTDPEKVASRNRHRIPFRAIGSSGCPACPAGTNRVETANGLQSPWSAYEPRRRNGSARRCPLCPRG
jgi:anthranilate phosphoribosyltransferase